MLLLILIQELTMKLLNNHKKIQMGVTLLELLITLTVSAILLSIAIPAYNNFITQKRLRTASEELYSYIKMAQTLSLSKEITVYLSFNPIATWCYGLSDLGPCDCTVANNCTVNGVQTIVNSANYSGPAIPLTITGFSGASSNPYIQFDGKRGTIVAAGTVSLSQAGLSISVLANTMGLVTRCSNTVASYPS